MSSSSELADSGRIYGQIPARTPEKSSNFAQTCNLLSQYLKEKRNFGDLSLGMSRNGTPETYRHAGTTTTMDLFPVLEKSSHVSDALTRNKAPTSRDLTSMDLFPHEVDSSVDKSGPETAEMTIFYGGQVIVFNDFPADKAKEVMLLATNGSSHNLATFASTPVQKPIEPTSLISTSSGVVSDLGNNRTQEHVQQRSLQPVATDLPKIARKASLTRFLEKRKDRIIARAPYNTSNSTESPLKLAENMSWLGLADRSPVQF